jgi:WD40 repeat protein
MSLPPRAALKLITEQLITELTNNGIISRGLELGRSVISMRSRRFAYTAMVYGVILPVITCWASGCGGFNSDHSLTLREKSPHSVEMQPGACSASRFTAYPPILSHDAEIIGLFPVHAAGASKDAGLVSIDKKGLVVGWTTNPERAHRLFSRGTEVHKASLSPTCDKVAFAIGTEVEIYSFPQGELLSRLPKVKGKIMALRFNPHGDTLLISSADGNIYRWRWDVAKGFGARNMDFERYAGHSSIPSALAYHPLGRMFFSSDWQGQLMVWLGYDKDDPYEGDYDRNILGERFFSDKAAKIIAARPDTMSVDLLEVVPQGDVLVTALMTGTLELWQVRGLTLAHSVEAHKGVIYDMSLSPSGLRIATAGRDGYLRIWKRTPRGSGEPLSAHSLEKLLEVKLTKLSKISFVTETRLFVGDSQGKVYEILLP